jgi:hypothetical protein
VVSQTWLSATGDRCLSIAGTTTRGFLLERGRLTPIQAPGARLTETSGINNRGQIVGTAYDDPDLTGARGFLLAKGATGPFTPVNVPGAPRTVAFGLNDRGQITGIYENPATTAGPQPTGTAPMDAPNSPEPPG